MIICVVYFFIHLTYLVCSRLFPHDKYQHAHTQSHQDTATQQRIDYPDLAVAAGASPSWLREHIDKFVVTEEESFRQFWARVITPILRRKHHVDDNSV